MTEGASHFCIETRGQAVLRHSLGQYCRSFSYRVRYMYRAKREDGENENTMVPHALVLIGGRQLDEGMLIIDQ